jgi:hypothetical protein
MKRDYPFLFSDREKKAEQVEMQTELPPAKIKLEMDSDRRKHVEGIKAEFGEDFYERYNLPEHLEVEPPAKMPNFEELPEGE